MSRVDKCLVLILLLSCFPLVASGDEQAQKIIIESDELEVDDLHGVSEYRGNVVFRRGSILLQADTVKAYEQGRQLNNIVANGQPVKLNQQLDNNRGETRAVAEVIEYTIASETLELTGKAHLWQAGNEFTGDTIIYHIQDETVVARSDKEPDSRVRIVIQPESRPKITPATPSPEKAPAPARPAPEANEQL